MTGSKGSASLMAIATGLFALSLWAPQPAAGKVFLTRSEALALAFPDCKVERDARYPTRDSCNRPGARRIAAADQSACPVNRVTVWTIHASTILVGGTGLVAVH